MKWFNLFLLSVLLTSNAFSLEFKYEAGNIFSQLKITRKEDNYYNFFIKIKNLNNFNSIYFPINETSKEKPFYGIWMQNKNDLIVYPFGGVLWHFDFLMSIRELKPKESYEANMSVKLSIPNIFNIEYGFPYFMGDDNVFSDYLKNGCMISELNQHGHSFKFQVTNLKIENFY